MTDAPLMTLRDVAARLGCSTRTVRRRIDAGDLAVTDLGFRGGLRVREQDLDAFLADGTSRRARAIEPDQLPARQSPRPRRRRNPTTGGRLVITDDMGRAA